MKIKKFAIIGSHGFPASYGGFETLAENLSINLALKQYEIIVFCSKRTPKPEKNIYDNNIKFIRIPLDASGIEGILYDILSFVYTLFYSKSTILYLGPTVGFALFITRIRNHKVVTNFGGLNEWERPKYKKIEWFLKLNYRLASYFSDILVCDNYVLKKSLQEKFNRDSIVIRYGGDHLKFSEKLNDISDIIGDKPYALVIARAQSDSMFELLIKSWEDQSSINLVIVSNWDVSDYGKKIKNRIRDKNNIFSIGPIYDKEKLTSIRLGAYLYIHSHSYCGTAPSLVESIALGCPIICFDAETNREVTENRLFYFKDPNSLGDYMNNYSQTIKNNLMTQSGLLKKDFKWSIITDTYSEVL
jgi:glycosyltransferase involved in cell wall biosynthesis